MSGKSGYRMSFRRLMMIGACLCAGIIASGCTSVIGMRVVDRNIVPVPTHRQYDTSLDSVWTAVIDVFSRYPVTTIERESGLLNTDWCDRMDSLRVVVRYGLFPTSMVGTENEETMPLDLRERFNVRVKSAPNDRTQVQIFRFVKVRGFTKNDKRWPWRRQMDSPFVDVPTSTLTEGRLLDKIGDALAGGSQ